MTYVALASSEEKQDKIVTEEREDLQGKFEVTGVGASYSFNQD